MSDPVPAVLRAFIRGRAAACCEYWVNAWAMSTSSVKPRSASVVLIAFLNSRSRLRILLFDCEARSSD